MVNRARQYYTSNRPALRVAAMMAAGLSALVIGLFAAPKSAQALTVSKVTPCSIMTTEASLCWTTDSPSDSQAQFGTDRAALTGKVSNTVQLETEHRLPIGPLRSGTRYFYQVISKDKNGATAESQVLFFDTARAAVRTTAQAQTTAAAPTLFDISIAASSDVGLLYFSTIPEVNTTISVAAAPGSTYTGPATYATTINAVDCPSGGCQFTVTITGLRANSTYNFTIVATALDNSSSTFGPLEFGSGSAIDDWKISTGSCGSVAIGSCSGDFYCSAGGQLVHDCNKCTYSCPAGLTCRVGGVCTSDVTVSNSNLQCNDAACYDDNGAFRSPAPIGCNSGWSRCNANVVLKVKKDRVCNQWQTCESSLETTSAQTGRKENLCLAVANCAAVDDKGNCSLFLPKGQCENDPLRFCSVDTDCEQRPDATFYNCLDGAGSAIAINYESPTQISRIQNLSGNVQAGLTFNGAKVSEPVNLLRGNFPYSNFQQVGDSFTLANGDFEQTRRETVRNKDGSVSTVTNYQTSPWEKVGSNGSDLVTQPSIANVLENPQDKNNPNHVLEVRPTDIKNSSYNKNLPGARAPADGSFTTTAGSSYYARMRARTRTGSMQIAVVLSNRDRTNANVAFGCAPVLLTTEWTTLTCRFNGTGSQEYLEVVRFQGDDTAFLLDDVAIAPVLRVNGSTLLSRSCRLFPRSDSPTCDYSDSNGVTFTGWHGYCVQRDPQNTNICLSWWPVDLIRGDDAFKTFSSETTQAYNDRTPLYFCLESKGRIAGTSYKIDDGNTQYRPIDDTASGQCENTAPDAPPSGPWSFKVCSELEKQAAWPVGANDVGAGLHDYDLASVELIRQNGRTEYVDRAIIPTSNTFIDEDDIALNGAKGDIIYEFIQSRVCDTCTHFNFRAIFDSVTRKLKGYYALNDDVSGDDAEPAYYHIVFNQRDICTKVVKVVNDSGEAKPWANRVARTSNFTVPDLTYTYTSDFAPFGATVNPAGEPETWNGLTQANAALRYPLYVELADTDNADLRTPFQVRGGSSYACVGSCGTQQCVVDSSVGTQCSTDDGCRRPSDDLAGTASAICEGTSATAASSQGTQLFTSSRVCYNNADGSAVVTANGNVNCVQTLDCPNPATQSCPTSNSKNFAATRLQRLFTKSFGFWTLDPNTGQYVRDSSSPAWEPPTTECTNGVRPAGFNAASPSTDYCAIRPVLTHVSWVQTGQQFDTSSPNNSAVVLDKRRGGVVKVQFNVNLDPEQVPLRSVVINWRFGEAGSNEIDTVDLSSPPRSDKNNPYVFFHQYGPSTTPHTIAISVRDNWDWCNGTGDVCPIGTEMPIAKQDAGETLRVIFQ